MKKSISFIMMCIITMLLLVGCDNNDKKTDFNLGDLTIENQTTESVAEPSSEYIEPTTSPKPTYEVTPYDLCNTMQKLFDKQTQQAFKSRAPGTQKPISPSVFPMSSYMISDWDMSSFKGVEHTYNILAGGLAYAGRGESVAYTISVSPVKSNFYNNSFVYYSGSKAEISMVFKIDINSYVEHNQAETRKNSGYAVAIFELSPNNPNAWLLSFLGEANEKTIEVLDYSNFILINEDGSSDYEDILAAEQESKKKAEEEQASIEASKEAQKNEEMENTVKQLKMITDKITVQDNMLYQAYNFDGKYYVVRGDGLVYYLGDNNELIADDYSGYEEFSPKYITYSENDDGSIGYKITPIDVEMSNSFLGCSKEFEAVENNDYNGNTYSSSTSIYYGYNNKTGKIGGIYSYTLIQQHYIILSKDVKYYRDIHVLDTEGYDVEFLVDNSIFDIVRWDYNEVGYGELYIVDGEVVDEDTFWSVKADMEKIPEGSFLGDGESIDGLLSCVKENIILE